MIVPHPDVPRVVSPVRLEEPPDDADEAAVAVYVAHLAEERGTELRPTAHSYCDDREYFKRSDFRVGRVYQLLDIVQRGLSLPVARHHLWRWASSWARSSMPPRATRCPLHLWRMSKATGAIYDFLEPCNDFKHCQSCADTRVEREVAWACDMFWRQEKVWMGVVPYSKATVDRLRQRRVSVGGCGCYWVRRRDTNSLHIYASKDLTRLKRKPLGDPKTGQWMSPLEATKDLVEVALDEPGAYAMKWTGDWKRPKEDRPDPTTFDLKDHPRDIVEPAVDAAEAILEAQRGIGARSRLTEEDVELVWLPMVSAQIHVKWEAVKEEAARRRKERASRRRNR